MKSKWLLYTESAQYHNGKHHMILEEIEYVNGEWYRHWRRNIQIIDINKPPGGYIFSIIFNDYNSAVKYKEYIENKYYNKINYYIDESDKIVKEFEKEFRFGTEKEIRKEKLNKINEL